MDNDRLEILMGKFVDSEIEPSEQRLLDAQLSQDPQSRRLFEEFRALHSLARNEMAPLADAGRPFEAVFSTAWKQSRRGRPHWVGFPGLGRFTAGIAAGLLLAVMIQVSLYSISPKQPTVPAETSPQAAAQRSGPDRIRAGGTAESSSPGFRNVDYNYYVDENGQRWMIEGIRENMKTQFGQYLDI